MYMLLHQDMYHVFKKYCGTIQLYIKGKCASSRYRGRYTLKRGEWKHVSIHIDVFNTNKAIDAILIKKMHSMSDCIEDNIKKTNFHKF